MGTYNFCWSSLGDLKIILIWFELAMILTQIEIDIWNHNESCYTDWSAVDTWPAGKVWL